MPITHKWNGTILTITSDSGTSSADLRGEKGDKGCRGPQGRAGVILNEDGTVDMTGYATETYVDESLANVEVDLTGYATESYVDTQITDVESKIPPATDLSDYYTKSEVDDQVANVTVDLTGYATETYVDTAIENIPDVDFTGYATETYVDTQIAVAQLEGAGVDTSNFLTTSTAPIRVGKGSNSAVINSLSAGLATGPYAATINYDCKATKDAALAVGYKTTAGGLGSFTSGRETVSNAQYQAVFGQYNTKDSSKIFIIGNGTSDTARSNAMTVDLNGIAHFAGDVYSSGYTLVKSYQFEGLQDTVANLYTSTSEQYGANFIEQWECRQWAGGVIELNSIVSFGEATQISESHYELEVQLPFTVYSPVATCTIEATDVNAMLKYCVTGDGLSATSVKIYTTAPATRYHIRVTGNIAAQISWIPISGLSNLYFPFRANQSWADAVEQEKVVGRDTENSLKWDASDDVTYAYNGFTTYTICDENGPVSASDIIENKIYYAQLG